jgi:hypothetical protein
MLIFRCVVLLVLGFAPASAQAQFRPVEMPPTPTIPALPPSIPTLQPPLTSPPSTAPTRAPSLELTAPAIAVPTAPPAAVIVPGCPGRSDCPTEREEEGPLSEAANELIKEFVKCEVEGKSLEQCLLDDPQPPMLSGLTDAERTQLTGCLGSNDLSAAREFWNLCVARVR